MTINLLQSITFQNTLDDVFRRGELQPVTSADIRALLEKEGADGKPIVLFVAGVRNGDQPGRYTLREVRRGLVYRSRSFLDAESARLREEKKTQEQAARTARLNAIKAQLRAGRKAEDADFDRKYGEQIQSLAEAEDTEIEAAAVVILEAEAAVK